MPLQDKYHDMNGVTLIEFLIVCASFLFLCAISLVAGVKYGAWGYALGPCVFLGLFLLVGGYDMIYLSWIKPALHAYRTRRKACQHDTNYVFVYDKQKDAFVFTCQCGYSYTVDSDNEHPLSHNTEKLR